MTSPITVLDLATHILDREASNGADFHEAGLPIMGGCEICQATIAAYNACPSKSGYLRCREICIGDEGFATVEEAHAFIFGGVR